MRQHPDDLSVARSHLSSAGARGAERAALIFGGADEENANQFKVVRRFIWLYFWLLIAEGALRKWLLPGMSDPLLVVRDPVLLLIYVAALRSGAILRSVFIPLILGIGALAVLFTVIGIVGGTSRSNVVVLLYGLRAAFGHLPLIFIIGRVFTRADVERVGGWVLRMLLPLVILVFLQYKGGRDAWVNVGVGGIEGGQITVSIADVGKTRPSAVFSDNTGLTSYLALVTAFLLAHFFAGAKTYRRWLGIAATLALVASIALALSRSTVGVVVGVVGAAALCLVRRPELFGKGVMIGLLVIISVAIVGQFAFFNEGLGILGQRFEVAHGIKVGIVDRMLAHFTEPLESLSSAPFFGHGLGVGTNVGAKLITGSKGFLLAEGDWERDVLEMGPLVGTLYILLRIGLVGYLTTVAWKSLKGGSALSFLLVGAGALLILNGNFAQATSLGFAVLTGGLCLAAAKDPIADDAMPVVGIPEPSGTPRIRGRALYAEKLHGSKRPG